MKRTNSNQSTLLNFGVKKLKKDLITAPESNTTVNTTENERLVSSFVSSSERLFDSHNQDIGFYLNNNAIDDAKKYKLLKHPWIPHSDYEFPISQNRRLKFQTDWFRRYAWLVYSKHIEGALCKT